MSRQETTFADSLYWWILPNRFMGLWPYNRHARGFVKLKYHFLVVVWCFLLFVLLLHAFHTTLERTYKGELSVIGIVIFFTNYGTTLLWICMTITNNDALLQLFYSFDEFDDSLKRCSFGSTPFKKFYQFRRVQFLLVLFTLENVCATTMTSLSVRNLPITTVLILGVLRWTFRLSHFLFVLLYCHVLESLRLRILLLKTLWRELVLARAHQPLHHPHVFARIHEIESLFHHLLTIVDRINVSVGSRLFILYAMMLCNICLYFYSMRNVNQFAPIILLSYPLAVLIQITLMTQNTISLVIDFFWWINIRVVLTLSTLMHNNYTYSASNLGIMRRQETIFADSLYWWILPNRFMGLWPYNRRARRFVKSKYHFLVTGRCFVLFFLLLHFFHTTLQLEVKRSLTGIVVMTLNSGSSLLWIFVTVFNNDALLQLLYSFDAFDESLKKCSSRSTPLKKFYQFPRVQFLIVLFVLETCGFTVTMSYEEENLRLTTALLLAVLRCAYRLSHFAFVLLYCHIIESLRLRMALLRTVWHEAVLAKAHQPLHHPHVFARINEIKSLYDHLLTIVDWINVCLGSRLVLLYAGMLYFICLYFYFMSSVNKFASIALLGYPLAVIVQITLMTHNTISSIDFTTELVTLPIHRLPDRILLQVYEFLQQVRGCSSLSISAAGFFHIDMRLLNSILMALASYLVAIFQLAPVMHQLQSTVQHSI